ncbi:MAG: META domain-containing protein [Rhodothermales bacterium]
MRAPLVPALALLFFGLLAAGCAPSGSLGDAPDRAVGPTWQLVTLGTDAAGAEATLTFDSDGRVFGTTGCNRYFGTYELAPSGALALSNVGSTRMACPPAEMTQETRFLDALNGAERVVVEGDRLMLTASGGPQLTFQSMPSETADATLSGTVTYRPRIALPSNAVLSVRLLDVSRADAPSVTLAEERLETAGSQVPLPFSLDYDSADVHPRNRYVVRAEIFDADGVLLWTTDTAYPVVTQGAPKSEIEIVLTQVTEADIGGLVSRTWRLAEIREPSGVTISYEGEAPFTLSFGADGRYNGQADCNQYGGTFEATPGGTLRLSQGLSTLAACPNPSVSQDFFGVFNSASRYTLADGRLTLSSPEGGALVFQ